MQKMAKVYNNRDWTASTATEKPRAIAGTVNHLVNPPPPPQGIFGKKSFGIICLHAVSASPYNILKELLLNITK
jgi:hypothetical protein